jgi:hypothetical protein
MTDTAEPRAANGRLRRRYAPTVMRREDFMANRRLENSELVMAAKILGRVRAQIAKASSGDLELAWALRRKVYKELTYDERGKPGHRRKLKALKREQQRGICPICCNPLPERYAILDRLVAMAGYTPENTRLIHHHCDAEIQGARGFR